MIVNSLSSKLIKNLLFALKCETITQICSFSKNVLNIGCFFVAHIEVDDSAIARLPINLLITLLV